MLTEGPKRFNLTPESSTFFINASLITTFMIDDSTVVFFITATPFSPLKIMNRIGTIGERL